jgi:hypothetical protein
MKNLLKIFALVIIFSGFAASVSAQVTLNSSASGVIVQTITLAKNYDLHFGNMAVTTTGGTCVLTPMAGTAPTRTITGGVTLPAAIGTPRAAEFYVTGVDGQNYIITIPQTDLTITNTTPGAGPNTMIVNTYTTDKVVVTASTWRGVLTGGNSTFYVGGTCNVLALQSPGLYQNLIGFPVTVNYE